MMDKSWIPLVLIVISIFIVVAVYDFTNRIEVWVFWGVFMYFLGVFTFSPFFMEE